MCANTKVEAGVDHFLTVLNAVRSSKRGWGGVVVGGWVGVGQGVRCGAVEMGWTGVG